MLKDAYAQAVPAEFARTPYGIWLRDEGVAVYQDWYVPNVWDLEMKPWARVGGQAAFIALYPMMEGERGMYVAEIPPGRALEPIRHLYEQIICVLDGNGSTEVWQEGDAQKHIFEWGRGSMFSPPLNTWYRMYNLGPEPVRFLAVNRAPEAMDAFQSPDFIFNCPYAFRDRFDGQQGYFAATTKQDLGEHGSWGTNFIPNAIEQDLDPGEWKSSGGQMTGFRMSGNQLNGHLSQWPVGRYHKAHYHGAGALLLGLRSEGYVLVWPREAGSHPYSSARGSEVIELPWGRGSLYSPPSAWFHQHFNTGREPARHLAIHGGQPYSGVLLASAPLGGIHSSQIDIKEGGTLLEYEDEDPEVRRHYREVLESNGVEYEMPDAPFHAGYAAAAGLTRPDRP